ncbi:MAG: NAD(P)/FAD-dependent oxidoreductase [Hyphomicrobiales bacterium]|nr:NAD(P)/FAD-dependent oxidoreductase [Hyphomicrobiales bacterium]
MTFPQRFDLIVLGAGPAGGRAALTAAAAGLTVILIDEQSAAGGQVWRKPRAERVPARTDGQHGEGLRAALDASDVTLALGRRVWSVTEGFRVDSLGPEGSMSCVADHLIVATGAHERVIPFPGWTMPGVMGLAAATILLKSESRLPGKRVVVAGRGPLMAQVAAGILAKGGRVVAVVDQMRLTGWLGALPALATQPRLLAQGGGWMGRVLASRTPWLFNHRVVEARGADRVSEIVVTSASGDRRALSCDALVIGDGLVPGTEVPRLLSARMWFDRLHGGWIPELTADFETSVPGLFCVGDGAGIRGALQAGTSGELAALAVARQLGRKTEPARLARLRRAFARASCFSDAVAAMLSGQTADVARIGPDTIVCRCEDVSRSEIDAAMAEGIRDINQIKHVTRCGMGPCQGRMCGDTVQELVALGSRRSREEVGAWTGRPPLRPVPLGDLVGSFDYGDIPVPEPAPL